MLWKSPGFTTVAVITLALGIGANTAMFSVINSVLLHSLPFRDSGRVMVVWKTMSNGQPNAFSTPAFLEMQQQGDILAHMGAISRSQLQPGGKRCSGADRRRKGELRSFSGAGSAAVLGRTFSAEEDHPGAGKFVILSHAMWQTRFESERQILGKAVSLDGAPYTVVGVMPRGFHVLSDKELFWVAVATGDDERAGLGAECSLDVCVYTSDAGKHAEAGGDVLGRDCARLKAQDPTARVGFG